MIEKPQYGLAWFRIRFTLALVVALPLAAGSAVRTIDPFSGREQPLVRVLGTVSLLALLWEVASELQVQG